MPFVCVFIFQLRSSLSCHLLALPHLPQLPPIPLFPPQVAAQATHFTELLQGLGGLARLGKAASAQAGIGYRKTVRQVRGPLLAGQLAIP